MKKTNILLIAACMFGMAGCNTLDLDPLDSVGDDQFWKSADRIALEQYCNDLYPKMISGHGDPQTYGYGMMSSDFQSDNLLSWDYNRVAFGHHLAPTDANNTSWNWEVIRACNIFIENYEKSNASESEKKQYLGEILFFKSMDYFNKVKAYGAVPWYSKQLKPGDADLYKGRDPRQLVMDSVLNDLNRAISLLPKKTKVYRISKDAALALKARACLFEGTFRRYHGIEGDTKFLQEAYNAAGELMKPEYGYSLYQGKNGPQKAYYELFIQADYNTNPEVILSKEYEPAKGKGNNLSRQIFKGETPIGMSKDAADDYLCATTGKPISLCGCPGHTTHTTFVAELQNRDPRMLQTIATPDSGDFTYYLDGKAPAIEKLVDQDVKKDPDSKPKGRGASSTGYCIVKFYNPAEAGETHHQGTLDAPIFRYGEILLIRAEAAAELGLDPELALTVNALRDRVGMKHLDENPVADPKLVSEYPVIKGANQNLIREIRRERRVEMMGEGLRYDDILRWKIGARLAVKREGFIPDPALYTPAEIKNLEEVCGITPNGTLDVYGKRVQADPVFDENKHYFLSIPINEMGLNPNLRPNNPGWD